MSAAGFTFDTVLMRGRRELELKVTYSVTPVIPARLYGDYPQPAEGGEVEVLSVKHNGTVMTLTEGENEALWQECCDRSGDDMAEEAAAAEDYRAAAQLAVAVPATDSPAGDSHRGWAISWDYGYFTATGPDYDASWEGEEDGWVDNGQRVTARTRDALIEEIDALQDEWNEANGQFGVGA